VLQGESLFLVFNFLSVVVLYGKNKEFPKVKLILGGITGVGLVIFLGNDSFRHIT
tara:strand:- start:402 stop:566 length:165 start_codon:yes stop_codon:yes gene_type:complete